MRAFSPWNTRKALVATQQQERASTRRGLSIEATDLHSPAFVDGRAQALTQRKFQAMTEQQPPSPLQRMVEQSPQQLTQRRQLQRFSASPQQGRLSISEAAVQRQHKLDSDENHTGIPDTLKAGLEHLSGMDLSQVRVHANSPRPAQFNALAYAQGNDIHLGPGQGHHLLHEAWHVVQQRQGRVKSTTQVRGAPVNNDVALEKGADLVGAQVLQQRHAKAAIASQHALLSGEHMRQAARCSNPVQRKPKDVIVTGVSHLVKLKNKTIYGGNEEREVIHGQRIVIETDVVKHSRRGPNQEDYSVVDQTGARHYTWFKVVNVEGEKVPQNLFIREDVFVPLKQEKGSDKLDQFNAAVEAVTDVPATLIGNEGITGAADALNDKTVFTSTGGGTGVTASDKQHAANMGVVGDSIVGVTGILGLAKGFKDLGDPEAKAVDLIETALSIERSAMSTGEAVSKLVHTASGSSTPTTASKFGSAFEGYGAAFSGIKEGFLGMKKVVTLINQHQDYSTEEKAKQAGEISLHALESAKSIVLSVKAFIELVNGTASGGLMASVPGLDIAVSGGKLIMDGYYLAISNANRKVMNERCKQIVQSKEGRDLGAASLFYRSKDAEIVNKKVVIESDKERFAKSTSETEKKRLQSRIERLELDIGLLEMEEADDDLGREDVAEYTIVTEFRDANTKRVARQAIHIATEMTKIAGSIATLTGVGAMGGAITKGAATAVDLALPATRLAKQAGRNRAARKMAKGKLGKSRFDHTKSTAAKADFRLRQVKYLIKLIIDVSYKDPLSDAAEFKTLASYLKATGVSTHALYKKNGDPQKQISMLLDAVQEREFI